MGFFSSDPVISRGEYREVRTGLFYKGFTSKELDELDKIVRGDIEETDQGINRQELGNLMNWLKQNPTKHKFSPDKIKIIEEVLSKKL